MSSAVLPAPAQPRERSLGKFLRNGDQIAHLVTFMFAASVFVVTVLLVYELWIHSAASAPKFGLEFSLGPHLGSGGGKVRRAAVHLRHGVDFAFWRC